MFRQYISTKSLPTQVKRACRTKKRSVALTFSNSVTLSGGYWSGGSRTEYWLIDLATGQVKAVQYPTDPAEYGGGDAPEVEVPAGHAIAEGGTFCGKPSTVCLHLRHEEFERGTPPGVVADWMEEHRRQVEADILRLAI